MAGAGSRQAGHQSGVSTLDYLLGNAGGQNHLDRAAWLLVRGADANALNTYSKRPVHVMAQLSGFDDMAALLKRHGATPVHLTGIDAFRAAVLRGDAPAARELLADTPNLIANPATLLAAAEFGNAAAVALLLDLGAAVDGLDHLGISPLHRAVQSGSQVAVEHLLAAGANIDRREKRWNGTPLTWSRALGHPHLTTYLTPLSRDVRGLCWLGMTDSPIAVLTAEPERISHTMEGDENPTLLFCLPDEDETAADVARLLLAHGAGPAVRNPAGKTAAEAARLHGLDEAADLLEGHLNPG